MKVICAFFGFIFGLTGFSCFYNLFAGRTPSSPVALFFMGIFSFAIVALCVWGFKRSYDKGKQTGSTVIDKTRIIDVHGKTSAASAAARGAVGGIVAGPIGSVVGASTAKSKRSTTFLIIYKNGNKVTKTVPNNSLEYQKYIKYLET